MHPLRPVDKLVKNSLDRLKGDFVVLGKRRMSLFTLSLIGMFMVGAIVAFGFLASRSGTLQGGFAATIPSCTGVRGPASTAESLGFVYFYADGIQNATDVKFAVWTDANGQDDIVWYKGSSISGTVSALIDLSKHVDEGVVNVHVYMFDGASPTLCGGLTFTKPVGKTPVVYQLSQDFSSADKQRGWNWKYQGLAYAPENTYTECGSDACWHGEGYRIIKKNIWATPDPSVMPYTQLRWAAPSVGSAHITGTIRAVGGTCEGNGDGVYIEVLHQRDKYGAIQTIWTRQLASGDTVGASFDKTATFTGQVLYPGDHSLNREGDIIFRLYPRGNNWCDWVEFDPKIEFTPATVGGGKVSVKKVFLPGISASPTLLLDGLPPTSTSGDMAYWENVTPGNRTLSVAGVPKVFYAACTDASACSKESVEGSTVAFNHSFGKNDFISVYLGEGDYRLYDGVPVGATSLENFGGHNVLVAANCSIPLHTNAVGDERNYLENSITQWSQTGVNFDITEDTVKGAMVPATTCDKRGLGDETNAIGVGSFDLQGCGVDPGNRKLAYTFFRNPIVNSVRKIFRSFNVDVSVDTGYILYKHGSTDYPVMAQHAFSHELGHLLGLPDSTDSTSVMYNSGNNTGAVFPSPADIAKLKVVYPQCVPQPGKLSISFSPNPATWKDRSGGTGKSTCRDGKMILPNGEWFSNISITETGGFRGVTLTGVAIEQYDTSGVLQARSYYNNFHGGIKINAGSTTVEQIYTPPLRDFALGKVTYQIFGTDDTGRAIDVVKKTLPLKTPPGGQEKLTQCKNTHSPYFGGIEGIFGLYPVPWICLGIGPYCSFNPTGSTGIPGGIPIPCERTDSC